MRSLKVLNSITYSCVVDIEHRAKHRSGLQYIFDKLSFIMLQYRIISIQRIDDN